MTECYVDFGEVGMFVPIFLIGLALGLIYRFFLRRTALPLLGMGVLAGAFAIQFYQLEMSGMKLFGSMVVHVHPLCRFRVRLRAPPAHLVGCGRPGAGARPGDGRFVRQWPGIFLRTLNER